MLELEASPSDDPKFLDLASRLIAGAAIDGGLDNIVAVHIDHWFGRRWLGFCGKLMGSAGVRSYRLDGELTPPPFHPHRVLSARGYLLTESRTFEHGYDAQSLHGDRPSQANINRTFLRSRLYAWYSGDTATTDKGVVMVYKIKKGENRAWYTGFQKAPTWCLGQTIAISPRAVHEFIEAGTAEIKQAEPVAASDQDGQ